MTLGRIKRLFGDRKGRSGIYRLLLATCILRAFRRATMNVENSVIPDVGSDGTGVHDIMTNSRNYLACVFCKFLLETES